MTTRAELSATEAYTHGHTAFMRAALDGDTETVRVLIHQGADINQRDDKEVVMADINDWIDARVSVTQAKSAAL